MPRKSKTILKSLQIIPMFIESFFTFLSKIGICIFSEKFDYSWWHLAMCHVMNYQPELVILVRSIGLFSSHIDNFRHAWFKICIMQRWCFLTKINEFWKIKGPCWRHIVISRSLITSITLRSPLMIYSNE